MQKCSRCGSIIPIGKRVCEKCGKSTVATRDPGPDEKICMNCGNIVLMNAVRCKFCKADVTETPTFTFDPGNCRKCGNHLNEGDRFCMKCGFPVSSNNSVSNSSIFSSEKPSDTGIDFKSVKGDSKAAYSLTGGWKYANIYTVRYVEPDFVYDCLRQLTANYNNFRLNKRTNGTIVCVAGHFDAQLTRTASKDQCVYRFEFTRYNAPKGVPLDFVGMGYLHNAVSKTFTAIDPKVTVTKEPVKFRQEKDNKGILFNINFLEKEQR